MYSCTYMYRGGYIKVKYRSFNNSLQKDIGNKHIGFIEHVTIRCLVTVSCFKCTYKTTTTEQCRPVNYNCGQQYTPPHVSTPAHTHTSTFPLSPGTLVGGSGAPTASRYEVSSSSPRKSSPRASSSTQDRHHKQ